MGKVKVKVLDSPAACNEAIAHYGGLLRELTRLETERDEKLAAAQTAFSAAAQPLRLARDVTRASIEDWCDAHRADLTGGGRTKSYRFDAGEIAWRVKPPRVQVRNVKKAIAWVLEAGARFRRFLRVSHELDKEAMLAEPALAEEIPGVRIGSAGEGFEIKPFETAAAGDLPVAPTKAA